MLQLEVILQEYTVHLSLGLGLVSSVLYGKKDGCLVILGFLKIQFK